MQSLGGFAFTYPFTTPAQGYIAKGIYRETIVLPLPRGEIMTAGMRDENVRDGLSFCCHFGLGTVQNLLELSHPVPHARVHVRLGTLDVVVEVVPEELDVRDAAERDGRVGKVTGEENKCHIANVFSSSKARDVADLEGWVSVRVQDLGSVLDRGLTPGIDEFLQNPIRSGPVQDISSLTYLQEHLAKDSISLFLEHSREDNSDTIRSCLDIDRFLVSVVDGHQFSLSTSLTFEILLRLESPLKRGCQSVSFEQCDR